MTVTVRHVDKLRFQVSAGEHTVSVDAAPADGGTGTALSAPQLFAAAVGACICEFVANSCRLRGIPVETLSLEVACEELTRPRRIGELEVALHIEPEPPEEIKAVLEATEEWIKDPTEENRRAAMEKAEAAEFSTAAGCAGLAAFFCGESMAPPDVDPVPPGEYMAAKAIAGSIVLSAVSEEPEKANEKFMSFVEQGMVVAEKIQLWTPPEESGG